MSTDTPRVNRCSPFSDIGTKRCRCPKMARSSRHRTVSWVDGPGHRRLYNALTARDSRFDGVFFVGVTSTDIYCRPICPAKTPKAANCRFFDTPQEAEQAGFRPCLRCRPELAPGSAPVDDAQRIAQLIVQRLEEGTRREGGARRDRRPVRAELAADPPHRPEGARRAADPAAADPPLAAGQAAPDRDDAADDRGRLRQRLLEPAPVQRRVQHALRHAADAPAQEGDRRRGRDRREPDVDAAALVSAAVRLERASWRFCGARAHGHRTGDRQLVCPDRAAGRREGLDQGDARAERSTRCWSSSRTA